MDFTGNSGEDVIMNLIDIAKIGLNRLVVDTQSVVETMGELSEKPDRAAVKLRIQKNMEDKKNSSGDQDQLKAEMVDALTSIEKLPFTASMSKEQLEWVAYMSVFNRHFLGDCPVIEDDILMKTVLSVSEGGERGKQIVEIIKFDSVGEEAKKKSLIGGFMP